MVETVKAALHGSPHSTDTGETMSAIPHSTLDRFWAKVQKTGTCWLWTAALDTTGYGQFRINGILNRSHRVAYELVNGPIPEGMQLDHLCRVRHCVNPDHLEPVTHRVNSLRGTAPNVLLHHAGHCKHGHPFTKTNTYVRPNGTRLCKACRAIRAMKYRQQHKEQTQ